jgi:hypothetical protein
MVTCLNGTDSAAIIGQNSAGLDDFFVLRPLFFA